MKSSLFLILILLSLFSSGQQQKASGSEFSLLDTTNLWSLLDNYYAVHIHPNDPYSYTKSSWYIIGTDTTINNISYKKLMKAMDAEHEKWSISGYLRQDANRVYSLEGAREILLYDFNLSVGSSMESELYPGRYFTSRLDSVREINLNSEIRKIYYLTEYLASYPETRVNEIWIEGIGSVSDGLLRKTMFGITGENSHDYQLLCFQQNKVLIYQSKNYQNCYYNIVVGTNDISISTDDFQIFPNPSFGQLTIANISGVTNSYFEIVNVIGETIKEFHNQFNSQIVIDLTAQKKGIYFLRLRNKNGYVTKKFILK